MYYTEQMGLAQKSTHLPLRSQSPNLANEEKKKRQKRCKINGLFV
jgi:hypothetical protein